MHVLIAPDKFKGSLTAAQAAAALAKGWREGWPVDKPLEIECLPVADGGIGLAAAFGFRFLDVERRELEPTPRHLPDLASIEFPLDALPSVPINVACDVKNPLLGPRGATRVYGLQKGLRDETQAEQLELGLARLADVAAQTFGQDLRDTPGAGAAGGLGFGLITFCGAELLPGFGLVASRLGLEAAVARADLVLTGEGSLDGQTLEGKAPAGVAAMARRLGRPVIAFGGRVEEAARVGLRICFDEIVALSDVEPELTQKERMAREPELLCRHGARLAQRMAAEVPS